VWPTRSIRPTTTPAGTSPAPRASSARPPPSASCSDSTRRADGVGDRACRDPGRRPARDVRIDGQGVPSGPRGAERLRRRRCWRRPASRPANGASRARAASRPCRLGVRSLEDHGGPGYRLLAATEHLQAVSLRHRQPSDDRRLHPPPRAGARPDGHRGGAAARGAARARPLQPAADHPRAAGQVLGLSRGGGRARAGPRRPARVHGRGGERPGGQARARAYDGVGDASITEDQARIEVELADGRRLPHSWNSRSATSIGR
jgi:hypothetical protein